mmetsp:Transcript_60283/g.143251  ORF Transcript_60283/g.143251 Transcript_60283/m.143251 type:complete len:205 (-) Transcript_60283:464-1078(-)
MPLSHPRRRHRPPLRHHPQVVARELGGSQGRHPGPRVHGDVLPEVAVLLLLLRSRLRAAVHSQLSDRVVEGAGVAETHLEPRVGTLGVDRLLGHAHDLVLPLGPGGRQVLPHPLGGPHRVPRLWSHCQGCRENVAPRPRSDKADGLHAIRRLCGVFGGGVCASHLRAALREGDCLVFRPSSHHPFLHLQRPSFHLVRIQRVGAL